MKATTDKGVLYIVLDDAEIMQECVYSAATLKKHSPGIPVQVITNIDPGLYNNRHFDYTDYIAEPIHPLKGKVKYLLLSRFRRTLFLDADTKIRDGISELFDPSDDFDIGMTYDNLCDWEASPTKFIAQVSGDINTGFLVYNNKKEVRDLLELWLSAIMPQEETIMRPGTFGDQHYFNEYIRDRILSSKDITCRILSNEIYNVRPWCWFKLKQENKFRHAKILHAHHLHHGLIDKIRRKLNSLRT